MLARGGGAAASALSASAASRGGSSAAKIMRHHQRGGIGVARPVAALKLMACGSWALGSGSSNEARKWRHQLIAASAKWRGASSASRRRSAWRNHRNNNRHCQLSAASRLGGVAVGSAASAASRRRSARHRRRSASASHRHRRRGAQWLGARRIGISLARRNHQALGIAHHGGARRQWRRVIMAASMSSAYHRVAWRVAARQ